MGTKEMKLHRGIAVPTAEVAKTIQHIKQNGISGHEGHGTPPYFGPLDRLRAKLEELRNKEDLTIDEFVSRDPGPDEEFVPGIWACGSSTGAHYYASHPSRCGSGKVGVTIEFCASLAEVLVDPRDFLCAAFSFWDSDGAPGLDFQRQVLSECFGETVLKYFERACSTRNTTRRIALGNLAARDPDVTMSHYQNQELIEGRYGTLFRSAFCVRGPISAERIETASEASPWSHCQPRFTLDAFLGK